MAARLSIHERRTESCCVLSLTGALLAEEGAREFQEAVDAAIDSGWTNIVVNLHEVTGLDSGGVGALVAKYMSARRVGGALKLVCPSRRACHVLAIAGLLKVFEAFEEEDEAIKSFDNQTPLQFDRAGPSH